MSSDGLSLTTRLELNAYSFVLNLTSHPDGTVNRRILSVADIKSCPSVANGVKSFDHTIDSSRDLWFRTFVPVGTNQTSLPVLFYFHGGGFVSFSPSTKNYDDFCRRLAAVIPAVVVSVNYRRAPEHKFPSQYDDGWDAVKFLDGNKEKIENFPGNADLTRCFLAGDSAGANIIHNLAVRDAGSGSGLGLGSVRIRGLVAIQPFFGGEERTESELRLANSTWLTLRHLDFYWKAFLPVGSDRDHPAVNVFGPGSKDISDLNLPPILVVVGGKDPLQDWQRRYYYGLKRSGKEVDLVEYPDVVHGFYVSVDSPESVSLVARVKEFVDKQLQLLD